MHIHTLRCFGAVPGDGNPALVIERDGLDLDGRQQIARERNTTCVFLDTDGAGHIRIDFFYPHKRSPLCVHATLAVAGVLLGLDGAEGGRPMNVETAMMGQRLQLERDGSAYFVRLAAQAAPQVEVTAAQVAELLRAPGLVPVSAPRVTSIGSPKLLVEVADTDVLYGLAPDLEGIADWGKQVGVNGIYAYCRLADGVYEGRNFNHLDPKLEDCATGVAAGALALALGRPLSLRQGRAVGRDCLIRVRIEGDAILVGGAAEAA